MKKYVITILILVMVCTAVTPAYAFTLRKAVELKNADEPFIDLTDLIGDAELGKGGNAETSLSGNTDQETPDEGGTGKAGAVPDKVMETITRVELVVSVHDTDVRLNGIFQTGMDALKSNLQAKYKTGMDLKLVDDYAEYNTYKEVLGVFEELGMHPAQERKQ